MTSLASAPSMTRTTDPLQLIDVDHVRFYVGNAKQAAYLLRALLRVPDRAGLRPDHRLARRGPLPADAGQHPVPADQRPDQGPPGGDGGRDVRRRREGCRVHRVRCREGVGAGRPQRGASRRTSLATVKDDDGTITTRGDQDLRRRHPLVRQPGGRRATYDASTQRQEARTAIFMPRLHAGRGLCLAINEYNTQEPLRPEVRRPPRRQRRARQDEPLGEVLRERARVQDVQALRRRGHLDRVSRRLMSQGDGAAATT